MMWAAGSSRAGGEGGKREREDSCWAQNCSIIVAKVVSIYISRSFFVLLFCIVYCYATCKKNSRGEEWGSEGRVVLQALWSLICASFD